MSHTTYWRITTSVSPEPPAQDKPLVLRAVSSSVQFLFSMPPAHLLLNLASISGTLLGDLPGTDEAILAAATVCQINERRATRCDRPYIKAPRGNSRNGDGFLARVWLNTPCLLEDDGWLASLGS